MKRSWQDFGREWLDTFVVAISVAMAFRAYFFEPFNIPTGSMQPTLYGNHSEPCERPDVFDRTPVLHWLKWAVCGYDYKEFVAPFSGVLAAAERNDGRFALFVVSPTGRRSAAVNLPTDVLRTSLVQIGMPVARGQKVWSGYDVTGDFIFVNRWRWNFFKPARGDVMVFSTTGINDLPQGTHYIKRMTALPGETIEIRTPDVFVDGKKMEPLKPMRGRRGELTPEPSPGAMAGPFRLSDGEYFACGDNSANSRDSRYWGAVPRDNLRGVASCVFWPLLNARWGLIQ